MFVRLGCHLNSAVIVGLVVGERHPKAEMLPYIVAQIIGNIASAAVLYLIASGKPGFSTEGGFASNGFGEHSPGGYSMVSALVAEIVLTFFFVLIILGSANKRAPQNLAPSVDSLDRHPGHQWIRQPRPQHRSRPLRRRLCDPAAGCSGSHRASERRWQA